MKLQLICLDWTMNWNVIFAEILVPSDVECGLTDIQMSYPKLSILALDLIAAMQPQHHRHRFAGTCVPENETGQVPTLSSVHFLE